jgi:ATP-binding cassette subfamily B protein/subfamily B ATP-binding cassette protein MsbA
MSVYRRALGYFTPFMGQTTLATLLTLALIPFNILKPWPAAKIVGVVLNNKPLVVFGYSFAAWSKVDLIVLLCLSMVVIQLISGWLNVVSVMLYVKVGLQGLLRLRTDLYAYLHALPLKFHDQRRSADSSFRVAYDSQALQTFYSRATFIFQTLLTFLSTLAAMFWLDWSLTFFALLIVPLMIATFRIFAQRIRRASTVIAERESALLTAAQEGLSSVKMVQAFGREDDEVRQFRTTANHSLEANIHLQSTTMKSALLVSTLMAIATAAVYYLGSRHVLNGSLTLADLLALAGYLVMLYQPIEGLTQVGWALEGAAAGAQRCFEVLDHQNDVQDAPDAKTITATTGAVAFENVTFGYTSDRLILKGINATIAPGETVAFVGGTGAGKSTLLSLVPRFYDPTGGRVTLDGQDLRTLTKKSLRAQISIVLQDTLLFSTTIRENIAYGRPDASEEEIIEAARKAQAYDFIMAMKDGFSSQVGERGGHLSVGQRQRIGIARAFLKNAPILLLDEPTSALDPTTEYAIMETMKELMRGRTTLIITHRIGTIHEMPKIVCLRHGEVVEIGTGPELVAKGGAYAELYHSANLG